MTQTLINILILFIAFFWQAYMQALIITNLFNIEYKQKHNIFYSVSMTVYSLIAKFIIPLEFSFLNSVFSLILIVLLFSIIYKKNILQSTLYAFIIFLLSIPTEAIAGLIVFKVFNYTTNVENVIGTIPVLLMINIWFTIVAGIILLLKNKEAFAFFSTPEVANKKSLYINVLLVTLIILPNVLFYTTNQYNYPLFLLIFNIVMNILLVALSIYNTYESVQLEKKKEALRISELHNKTLTDLLDGIRTFKHDHANTIHAISGYLSFNDIDGLKKYFAVLEHDTKKNAQLESISPIKISEPSIYTLIATKYDEASKKDIFFRVETMYDYQKLAMPTYDFTKILGVLIDNAIEAAEECETKEINISFRRIATEQLQIFTIENTYMNKNINTEEIFEKDFSTKNRNSGIGLWEVKNLVDRNVNVNLVTSKDEKYFTQRLFISEILLDD